MASFRSSAASNRRQPPDVLLRLPTNVSTELSRVAALGIGEGGRFVWSRTAPSLRGTVGGGGMVLDDAEYCPSPLAPSPASAVVVRWFRCERKCIWLRERESDDGRGERERERESVNVNAPTHLRVQLVHGALRALLDKFDAQLVRGVTLQLVQGAL